MDNHDLKRRIQWLSLLSLTLLVLAGAKVLSGSMRASSTAARLQDDLTIEPRGHVFGWMATAALDPTGGDRVFLGEGSGFTVRDVSDPGASVQLGSLTLGKGDVTAIVPVNTIAYAVNGNGLRMVDTSDPTQPTLVASTDLPGAVGTLAVSDAHAYVARSVGWTDGWVHTVDVSDARNPTLLTSYDTPGAASDIAVITDTVVVADGDSLLVLDASDPLTLTELGTYEPPEPVHTVHMVGTTAFLLTRGGFPFGTGHLRIVDLSNPTNPNPLGSYADLNDVNDLHVVGNLAYVADGDGGLQILDVADLTQPAHLATFDVGWSASGVVVSGSRAYLTSGERGLSIVDVTDPEHPAAWGDYERPSAVMDVIVEGTSGYIAGYDRVWTVDLTDPLLPVSVGSAPVHDLIGLEKQLAVVLHPQTGDSLLYAAEEQYGLQVFDISDPSTPASIGHYPMPAGKRTSDVSALDDYAYVTTENAGDGQLHILDLSDPTHPSIIETVDTAGDARSVVVTKTKSGALAAGAFANSQSLAFVADGPGGLRVIDVSDPNHPDEISHIDPPSGAETRNVAVANDQVFIASNTGSAWHLQAYDVTDPANPTLLAERGGQGSVTDIDANGRVVCVTVITAEGSGAAATEDSVRPGGADQPGAGLLAFSSEHGDGLTYEGGYEMDNGFSIHLFSGRILGFRVGLVIIDMDTGGAEMGEFRWRGYDTPTPSPSPSATSTPTGTPTPTRTPTPGPTPECGVSSRISPAKAEADGCTLSPFGLQPCECGVEEISFEHQAVAGWEWDGLHPPAPVTCPDEGTTSVVGQFAPFVTIAGSGDALVCVGREDAPIEERTRTVLPFTIQASEADTWELTSMTFQASGDGDDAIHIAEVRLYHDGSRIGTGGTSAFSSDDGTVTFTFPKIVITTVPASFRLDYVFDFEAFGGCSTEAKDFEVTLIDPDSGLEPQNYKPGKYHGGAMGSATVGCVMHEGTSDVFDTIQNAVDGASPGTTVLVCPGTYEENVDVSKSVTIRSTEGPDETTIRPARAGESVVTLNADNSVIEGFIIRDSEEAGLLVRATGCTVADCVIRNNGNDGVHTSSGQISGRSLVVTENGGYGVYAPGRTSAIELADVEVTNNGHSGIWAQHGTVSVQGSCKVNGNGSEYSHNQCLNWGVGGIVAEGAITTQDIEASHNCGFGITSVRSSIHVQGSGVTRNNTRGGMRARGDVTLDGASHVVSDNGEDGIYARGTIRVEGQLVADNNNTWSREHQLTRCWNHGTGGLVSWKDVTVGDLVATDNCGYGVAALGSVTVKGSATVLRNENAGIRGPAGVTLSGPAHVVSHNGSHGIQSRGDVRLANRVSVNDNGRWSRERGFCAIAADAGLSVHGDISADDLEIRSNCGHGVSTGGRLLVTDRAQSVYNTRSGILALGVVLEGTEHDISHNGSFGIDTPDGGIIDIRGSARVNDNEIGLYGSTIKLTSGEVCGNRGRGIIVRSGGTLSQGTVKVCDNGGTGIDYPEAGSSEKGNASTLALHRTAQSPASVSSIVGSAIVGNGGEGVRVAGAATELAISACNIEDNAGYGVYSDVPNIVTARGNWWGDAGGPGGIGPGDGDEISGTVSFEPWLADPVSFAVVSGEDPVYAPRGLTRSSHVTIRTWGDANEIVNVTVSDDMGWLSGPSFFSVTLEPGGQARVPISFTLPSTVALGATNPFTVTATPESDPLRADIATFSVVAASVADLAVVVETQPDFPVSTGPLTYAVSVMNGGPDRATGLVLTDTLPPGVKLQSAAPTQGSCEQQGREVICALGGLSLMERVGVTITVVPESAGVVTNTMAVAGREQDPALLNNTARQISFVDLSDLSVTLIEAPDRVHLGDPLTYTLTIANDGPADATGVVMTDTVSGDAVIESTDITLGACHTRSDVATCSLGDLSVGAVATATVVVKPTSVGTITTTASVAGNQPDFPSVDLASALTVVLDPSEEKTVYLPLIMRSFAP